MEEYYAVLSQCPLFAGIQPEEYGEMLRCMGGRMQKVSKGTPILLEGDPAMYVGVVLSGSVQVVRDDFYGNRSVLTAVTPGGLFGEAFACAGLEFLPVSVIAPQNSAILLLECRKILSDCSGACAFHNRLVRNLLQGIAQKNLVLTRKIRCMSRKTTREKLMEYLLGQAKQQGSADFVIPFDRQALADYPGVERSAMSAEIGKLRREGLLESEGSWFHLLSPGLRENE